MPRGGIEPPTLRFSEAVLVNDFNDLARPHSAKLALYNSGLQNSGRAMQKGVTAFVGGGFGRPLFMSRSTAWS